MKYSTRYIIFSILVLAAFWGNFHMFFENYQEVQEFRGAQLDGEIFYPMIASSVNESPLTITIDNKVYSNEKHHFFMSDDLEIMIPVDLVSEALNCSSHIYDNEKLLIEKRNMELVMGLGEDGVTVNGSKEAADSPLVYENGAFYVSLPELANHLEYSYSFDIEENKVLAANISENTSIIPASYDLRQRGRAADIRNQGNHATCWAAASLGALESTLLPEEKMKFAVDHMTQTNSFSLSIEEGGAYPMSMAYLTAWQGPVKEEDDPYGDGVTDENLTAVKHVQEIQVIDGKDYEKIKEAVYKYGGVQTSIYIDLHSSLSRSKYYRQSTASYCYVGAENPNHDVVIIGWDDNFSRENFSVNLDGDGAFICQNSWGEDFGEEGIFYVSYYDINVGTHNVAYTRVEDSNNYDNLYQSDLCGWVGQIGYNKEGLFGANVYRAKSQEVIRAAGFYATGKDSEYELYVVKDFADENSLREKIPVASGKLSNAGYYTIEFNQEIEVERGEQFAVVLFIVTPGAVHPLAIEYAADKSTEGADLEDGLGFISSNGSSWQNVMEIEECNLCIKAYTNNR